MQFPSVDPIPLPAPIWLMKLLSHVTLALHFTAVMMLVGSLALIIWHVVRGRARRDNDQVSAGYLIAKRLPVLMTFVINLGVPPLLFAQVIYGRAIYSSSVLIAVMWFSVILLLMLDYWLIYQIAPAIESGKRAALIAFAALMITMGIGQIYSMNMTLMLRPEVWQQMYAHSPTGLQSVHGDPTTTPRWLFVMSGGLVFGGLVSLFLSNLGHIGEGVRRQFRRSGGLLTAVGAALQIGCALLVVQRQSAYVQHGLGANPLYSISGLIFLVTIALTAVLALFQGIRASSNMALAIVGFVTGLLSNIGAVVYRDGIRDLTLMQKGMDIWHRTEVSNWSVIVIFLLLFVLMLGIIVWLIGVMRKATPQLEQVTL